jgi:Spy/CpxP family protein refolding chaperone
MKRWGLILLIPLALAAQPRGPRPWWNAEVAKELNLTDAQTQQLKQVEQDFRPRMSAVRDEVNKAESGVEAAFNEDPVDQSKAEAAITRLAAARSELTKAVSEMDLKLRTVLTAQQWQQLQKHGRGPWNGRGPGMHRRRPPTPTPNGNQHE